MHRDDLKRYSEKKNMHGAHGSTHGKWRFEMINIKISTDGAAFERGYEATEVAAILRSIADRISGADDINTPIVVKDSNGNWCGTYEVD